MSDPKFGIAYVEDYEDYDEQEGSYDRYECSECGAILTDSIRIQLDGDKVPKTCPSCGRRRVVE